MRSKDPPYCIPTSKPSKDDLCKQAQLHGMNMVAVWLRGQSCVTSSLFSPPLPSSGLLHSATIKHSKALTTPDIFSSLAVVTRRKTQRSTALLSSGSTSHSLHSPAQPFSGSLPWAFPASTVGPHSVHPLCSPRLSPLLFCKSDVHLLGFTPTFFFSFLETHTMALCQFEGFF